MEYAFEIEHAYLRRDGEYILEDVNLSIKKGERIAIVGPNGAGKSSLMDVLSRVVYPLCRDDYKNRILGQERWIISELKPLIGRISPQDDAFFNTTYPVREIVASGLHSSLGFDFHHVVDEETWILADKALEKYGEPCADAMVESALEHAKILEDNDFFNFKISVKSSDTLMMMDAYRKLAAKCDYPLHLGVTEAGGLRAGTVKSALGIGTLLMEGIGDTLRVSLTADVTEEIKVGFEILRTLGLRYHGVRIVSCPTCARRGIDVEKVVKALEVRLEHISEPLKVAVMGCVVNGPGEAREADVGVCGGGNGKALLFVAGQQKEPIDANNAVDVIADLVEKIAAQRAEKK